MLKTIIKVTIYCSALTAMVANPIFAKPQSDNPAAVHELTIPSFGSRMPGLAYLAAGIGPHPTILLLHGYPGNEKNLDVAQAMRSKGWNVVFFHYRGAWGSEGEFSFLGSEKDVTAVLNYMTDDKNAADLRIDRNQISLVGHSMGGHLAIAGILDNPVVRCAVAYDGANLGSDSRGLFSDPKTAEKWKLYSDSLFMLNGWSGAKAMQEIAEHGTDLDLVKRVNTINGRPVLLIPADSSVIPLQTQIMPLVNALKATANSHISYKLISDDHSFSSSRQELIETTASFLNKSCR